MRHVRLRAGILAMCWIGMSEQGFLNALRSRGFATTIRWILTICLLGIIAGHVDFAEIGGIITGLHWHYIAFALVLVIADRVVATVRWWLLLRVKGIDIGFGSLFVLHLTAGFIGSFLPTSFGVDAVRVIMITRRAGRGMECTAASVVDRLIMIAGTLVLAAVMTGLYSASLPLDDVAWLVPLVAISVVVAMGLALRSSLLRPFFAISRRYLGGRITARLSEFYWAIHAYHRHRLVIVGAALLTAAVLFVRILIILALGLAVGAQPGFVQYLLVMPLGAVIMMLPISVGGFGLQEGVYAALLGMIGISLTQAVSISLLDHVTARAVALVGVFFWMVRPPGAMPARPGSREKR